jgi:hypothetical protein
MAQTTNFDALDYVVLGATLGISMMIGVYYGVFKKQETNADLLVGYFTKSFLNTKHCQLTSYSKPFNIHEK